MTIKSDVLVALTTVLANSWAVELPAAPTWPAMVFDIDTRPETTWVLGGGYDQHTVNVVILARTLAEIPALQAAVDSALSGIAGYLVDEERGDAAYQNDASIYGYFSQHVIRTRRT